MHAGGVPFPVTQPASTVSCWLAQSAGGKTLSPNSHFENYKGQKDSHGQLVKSATLWKEVFYSSLSCFQFI